MRIPPGDVPLIIQREESSPEPNYLFRAKLILGTKKDNSVHFKKDLSALLADFFTQEQTFHSRIWYRLLDNCFI